MTDTSFWTVKYHIYLKWEININIKVREYQVVLSLSSWIIVFIDSIVFDSSSVKQSPELNEFKLFFNCVSNVFSWLLKLGFGLAQFRLFQMYWTASFAPMLLFRIRAFSDFSSDIRYAAHKDTDRLTPAMQWTIVFPPAISFALINSDVTWN